MEITRFVENDNGTFGNENLQVILYRHATSNANIKFRSRKQQNIGVTELELSEEERDSEIAEVGIELSISKQRIFNNLNIHNVFVSPMRRALQTAYHTFKISSSLL